MQPRPLPQSLRPGQSFRTRDVAGALGPERLRRSDLSAPTRGIRTVGDSTLTPEILSLVLEPHQFFSHETAVLLWGLPVPGESRHDPGAALHVTSIGTSWPVRRAGVVGHRSAMASPIVRRGLRLSTRSDAWAECSAAASLDDLVILGDAIVGRQFFDPLDDLRVAAARRAGRIGAKHLREALDLIRVGAESPQETRLRLLIVRDGQPEPRLNVDAFDAFGRFLGRPDLSYPDLRVAIEYEGDHHRVDQRTFRSDIRRRERFAAAGWRTLRVVADDLTHHAPEFLARLAAARAAARPPAPPRPAEPPGGGVQ